MTRILVLFAALAVVAGADRVFAHHSFSATYDSTQKVEIEGVVKEFVWRDPHSFMRIDVTDKDGSVKTSALEWGSTNDLTQAKIGRTTLKPGDKLKVTGEAARDASSLRLLISSVERRSDGSRGGAGSSKMRRAWFPSACADRPDHCRPTLAPRGGTVRAGGLRRPGAPARPKDLTGTSVSVVTEHWHLRMMVPPRSDFSMIPANPEARKIANAGDRAEEPTAEACKASGATTIMRVPGDAMYHGSTTTRCGWRSTPAHRRGRCTSAAQCRRPRRPVAGLLGGVVGRARRARARRAANAVEGRHPDDAAGVSPQQRDSLPRERDARRWSDRLPNRTAKSGSS